MIQIGGSLSQQQKDLRGPMEMKNEWGGEQEWERETVIWVNLRDFVCFGLWLIF